MDHFINEFTLQRPKFEKFQHRLTDLIKELLIKNDLEYFSFEGRTKTIESFAEKIKRKGKNYVDPVNELTDLCGLRIITFYTEDIYKIAELIEAEFQIDTVNSIDKTKIDKPDRFGYQSLHYIINLNNKRNILSEWDQYKNLKCEIQIRTILQHSWSVIDHKLRYKSKNDVPTVLKRKIYRLSALLELADEEFLSLKNKTDDLMIEIEKSIDIGDLELEFNQITLAKYLINNSQLKQICKMAVNIGFKDIDENELLNIYDDHFLSRLIAILSISSIKNIQELDSFISFHFSKSESILKKFHNAFIKITNEEFAIIPSDILIIIISLNDTSIKLNSNLLSSKIDWPVLATTLKSLLST